MQEMNLRTIFGVLLARIKLIIAAVAVGVLLFASYAYFFVPEQYTSSALLIVHNKVSNTQESTTTASNLSAAEYLAKTYSVIMKTEPVLNKALAQLDNEVTLSELKQMVSATLMEETTLLQISAVHSNPKTAQRACDAIAQAVSETVPVVMDSASSAKVVEKASKAHQTAPNVVRNALIGALVGFVLSIAFALLREFLDNTIRDKATLQMQFDVPVLGEIPSFTQIGKGDKRHA